MAPSQHAWVPVPASDEDTDEGFATAPAPKTLLMSGRRMIAFVMGTALAGAALVALVRGSTMKTMRAETDQLAAISQLSQADPCADKPQIKLSTQTRSNLAKVSNRHAPEGLIFPGVYIDPETNTNKNVKVLINAEDGANSVDTHRSNGLWGKYAGIAIKGGTKMRIKFRLVDGETDEPVILRAIDITFFDLDKHSHGQGVEYVKLFSPNQYFLTTNTLAKTTVDEAEKSVTFTATKTGNSQDNPKDPLLLTIEQKNKAVTVKYQDTDSFEVELGTTGTVGVGGHRGFNFVFRPSLLCSKTTNGNVDIVTNDLVTTTTTTKAGAGGSSDGDKKNCLFTVPIINWCFPKFW